jgi:hypothetical protein
MRLYALVAFLCIIFHTTAANVRAKRKRETGIYPGKTDQSLKQAIGKNVERSWGLTLGSLRPDLRMPGGRYLLATIVILDDERTRRHMLVCREYPTTVRRSFFCGSYQCVEVGWKVGTWTSLQDVESPLEWG